VSKKILIKISDNELTNMEIKISECELYSVKVGDILLNKSPIDPNYNRHFFTINNRQIANDCS
jgi:hypothetical protein